MTTKPVPGLLALFLIVANSGCVTYRQFEGSTTNLSGNGNKTLQGTELKVRFASGETDYGGNYMVLGLPQQKCEVILFYPGLRPWPDDCFEVELATNHAHAWQIKDGYYLTHYIATNVDLPAAETAVWLARGKPLRHSLLKRDGKLPPNAEPLYGRIQLQTWKHGFHIDATLSNRDGAMILGSFESYKALWGPLMIPAMIFDIGDGASKPVSLAPTLKTNVIVP